MLTLPCISICVPYLARCLSIVAIVGVLMDVEDIVVFPRSLGDHFLRTGDQGDAGRDTGSD